MALSVMLEQAAGYMLNAKNECRFSGSLFHVPDGFAM